MSYFTRTYHTITNTIAGIAMAVILSIGLTSTAEASLKPFERNQTMRDASPLLLGITEVPSENIAKFPKWVSAMARSKAEQQYISASACNQDRAGSDCAMAKWQHYINSIKHYPKDSQVILINDYVNKQRYARDVSLWNVGDYWATPKQFFENGGDCEDFAITKFISLRMLGIPNEDMRIVVANDRLSRNIHAVLAVRVGNETYYLDNQVKKVLPTHHLKRYQPIYSINETNWWKHNA